MSRIGKQPVPIPDKVKVDIKDPTVSVEGPKGKVAKTFASVVKIALADKAITVAPTEQTRFARAMYGTARSVIAGMVKGVSVGYLKELEIQGVGFKANLKGKELDLALGGGTDNFFHAGGTGKTREFQRQRAAAGKSAAGAARLFWSAYI